MDISYNQIVSAFPQDEWDFSYLTGTEMREVLNYPIKYGMNKIEKLTFSTCDFSDNSIFLVYAKKSSDYDYTMREEFKKIVDKNFSFLNYVDYWCNFKHAAVLSGLCQYAKNSLVYHKHFHFEIHLNVCLIKNSIFDLPVRNKANFNLLPQCTNCNDCINACPVSAIHYDEYSRGWVDAMACELFCHFGNHDRIPSMKYGWAKLKKLKLTERELYNIKNFKDSHERCGEAPHGEIVINDIPYYTILPVCRECTSQKKCSKYNGKYPYDWDNIKILQKNL